MRQLAAALRKAGFQSSEDRLRVLQAESQARLERWRAGREARRQAREQEWQEWSGPRCPVCGVPMDDWAGVGPDGACSEECARRVDDLVDRSERRLLASYE